MKIGSKVGLGILSMTSVVLAIYVFIQAPAILSGFEKLQSSAAKEDLQRSYQSVLTEANALRKQAQDWASWDDTYGYVKGKNPKFEQVNFGGNFFDTTHVDLVWIYDTSGNVVKGVWRDRDGLRRTLISSLNPKTIAFPSNIPDKEKEKGSDGIWGLYEVEGRPMLTVTRPVLDSGEKLPAAGVLIMGRFLGPDKVKELSAAVGVKFSLVSNSTLQYLVRRSIPGARLSDIDLTTKPAIGEDVEGYRSITTPDGKSNFGIVSKTAPKILRDGESTVSQAGVYIILVTLVGALLSLVLIDLLVTKPLAKLSAEIRLIGEGQKRHICGGLANREDEVGEVSRYFQNAFEQLEEAKLSLVKSSHEAGMASVAREVLHNAGNVFNSIRVAVGQLHSLAASSKLPRLRESVMLLEEHKDDLSNYITEDPQGTKLIPYLSKLTEHLEQEHQNSLTELTDLNASVTHMGEVIQAQHTFAHPSSVDSEVFLAPLLEESARIVRKSLERHGVSLQLRIEHDLKATCNAPLLIRVLVNLITNAKDALECRPAGQRRIEVSLDRASDGSAVIEVSDNGEGIAPEEAALIFTNGFTTKPNGTGYGLHYSANTLKEMGWSIQMQSNGRGKGASFVLTDETGKQELEAA